MVSMGGGAAPASLLCAAQRHRQPGTAASGKVSELQVQQVHSHAQPDRFTPSPITVVSSGRGPNTTPARPPAGCTLRVSCTPTAAGREEGRSTAGWHEQSWELQVRLSVAEGRRLPARTPQHCSTASGVQEREKLRTVSKGLT